MLTAITNKTIHVNVYKHRGIYAAHVGMCVCVCVCVNAYVPVFSRSMIFEGLLKQYGWVVSKTPCFFFRFFPPHFCATPCCATLLKVSFFV